MDPKGTVIFATIGRPHYGFDIFSLELHHHHSGELLITSEDEHGLTDSAGINFNAQFINHHPHHSIVFISERSGSPAIYQTRPDQLPLPLPSIPHSLFHDRPILKNNRLFYISAHEKPDQPFKSWSALYSTNIDHNSTGSFIRLTPHGAVDYSPAISLSGNFMAVASYGSRSWGGEFQDLNTDIVLCLTMVDGPLGVAIHSIYFHRQADDGWWSVFQVTLPENFQDSELPKAAPLRVTPPGVHCFTPAAFQDGKRIAVATRRKGNSYRHVEIFDVESKTFYPATALVNPSLHHYNPFVSSDSMFLGYHRFRGESTRGGSRIPHLDPVLSPVKDLRMLRLNGSFPSSSPDGDLIAFNSDFDVNGGLKVVKSDGSKRWTLIKGRLSFSTSWGPTEKHVIYTSIGPIFESVKATVQIARVSFHPGNLTERERRDRILTREETGNNAFPSCSPDGKSVVFRSGRSGYKNLYITDAVSGEFDGGRIHQLTDGPWIDTMPSWSPNGDLIAFSSNRHNPGNVDAFSIYLVKPDGSDLKRLCVAGPEGSSDVDRERINHVCFSPDGEWLLFAANFGGVTAEPVSWPNQFQPYGDLYVARLDGTGLRRLTWNGYENGTPAWHTGSELDLGRLSLGDEDGDKLRGQFVDPLWLSSDI
uniref:Dipeptidylpeptidase IV N-terminal domain-containing protein n=2 Tax=Salix viminalis TaxID=40686 RepID=A0A6N2NCF6_SALVM